jgi:hypothetical protein
MATLGPDSPRRRGRDTHGVPREPGDIDTDGYLVGWIAPDGSCWHRAASTRSRSPPGATRTPGSAGTEPGALGAEPDPARFVTRHCSPDCEDEALRECADAIELLRLGIAHRTRAAQRN